MRAVAKADHWQLSGGLRHVSLAAHDATRGRMMRGRTMRRWAMTKWGAMFGALALAGCSAGEDVPLANKAIDRFHAALNAGQFDPIYAGSAKDMKETTPQPRLVALLAAVHRKLGTLPLGRVGRLERQYQSRRPFHHDQLPGEL
ncbi:hypothetical protein U1839_02070 [Sphingomonas sp. RT2P30]|uniref:hypothetical protein n=1 Tax=Parasphingomonas halimpatiens TaxID=3096162 RepID=UPI002FCB8057